MDFLNPTGLYAFYLLPLLLFAYLIRRRPRRRVFSSLLLLHELRSRSPGRPWGRLRLPPIFFLQLLLLSLLALALGEPIFSASPSRIAVVLDNSASMQSLEGAKSRFEMAQDEARSLLLASSGRARVDLFLTVPRLERVGAERLAPNEALSLINTLRAYDLGDPSVDYSEQLHRLTKEKGYERVYFLTDHPARSQGAVVRVVTTGRPKENFAIASFRVSHPSLASPELRAAVEIANFSSKEARIKVSLQGAGNFLASQTQTIGAGKSAEVAFEGIAPHPYYEAALEVRDALPLDDRRFAVPPSASTLEILAVSPRPASLNSLRSIPGVTLKVISPEAYEKTRGGDHLLEIFQYSAPALPPQRHALFVLPPERNPLVVVEEPVTQPVISAWREPHPLTRYVNFTLFRPHYARPLKPRSFGDTILQSPEGALALALEQKEARYLVLGFDPFPYLGRENLPMSIFTLNLLGWFHEGLTESSTATGAPLRLAPGFGGGTLTLPTGEKFPVRAGSAVFRQTFHQGVYQATHGEDRQYVAVNLDDAKESNLMDPLPIDLQGEVPVEGGRPFAQSLLPYLLLLSLLLLFLEWFFNPASARPTPEHARAKV